MARFIRMDSTGHSTLAEWTTGDQASYEAAVEAFRRELDEGFIAVVDEGEGRATPVRELPLDSQLVIMRRPIAGGGALGVRSSAARAVRRFVAAARRRRVPAQAGT